MIQDGITPRDEEVSGDVRTLVKSARRTARDAPLLQALDGGRLPIRGSPLASLARPRSSDPRPERPRPLAWESSSMQGLSIPRRMFGCACVAVLALLGAGAAA